MISSFNIDKLTALLKDFYTVTQIRITVFDENFNEIAAFPERRAHFCEIVRACPAACEACVRSDRNALKKAAERRSIYTYRCHAGLYESIMPIFLNRLLIGYLFFGHVLRYESYEEGFSAIREACRDYDLRISELLTAVLHQPLIGSDYLQSAASLMEAIASFLCMERLVELRRENLPVRIDEYIRTHLQEDLSAAALSEHFGIGKTKLYEIAKESYGTGIADLIRHERIERAKELLRSDPSLTTAEIAEQCGFSDYNNFITLFRKMTGMTPRRYKEQQPGPGLS